MTGTPTSRHHLAASLGPAFVAAVAYVDPGNVAANISAGSTYGYLLVWVLVLANAMAVLIQYCSAKLGLVTGQSLPALLGDRLSRPGRLAFWVQAELVAAATDLAEVIGGAIALHLLFALPLPVGGIVVGAASMLLLTLQNAHRQRQFEAIVGVLLVTITVGFLCGLFLSPPSPAGVLGGLVPRFADTTSVLLAASMLGATVMPHAIYLHSSLVNDRFRAPERNVDFLLRATRHDVVWALIVAGAVNIGLLLLAASTLGGVAGTDTIEGAHAAITGALGPIVGAIFAIGLLASGLASTSVGAYAGSEIMKGLLHVRIPLLVRRLITLVPAIIVLWAYPNPSWALVVSQVALSFGIPFAIIPLARYTRRTDIMGTWRNSRIVAAIMALICVIVVVLNAGLIVLTVLGVA
ncbi:Nramp family divalent metal transporter [Nanchangia anserum]|uniref:Nramp family divalent metal transporter n=1 Tax=Nanchangia anserum TaxID=2692125 RepID=A0A8I0G8Y9_9ACTO|nr:Nramp family divalent metal transporter [Nanchangia anserum]MBD3690120.1 Nramp family divalent metal transporter [Nanchangia anserum]QOX82095.1 Nramp family divalent metal transporter [Nanchangia anserum]